MKTKIKGGSFLKKITRFFSNRQTGYEGSKIQKEHTPYMNKEANDFLMTKNEEIKQLRDNHSNETPSIYLQNSHSSQTTNCLKVPQNTLIIFTGASGEVSKIGSHKKLLSNSDFIKLLKKPITNKKDMDKKLKDIRKKNWYPMLTFHYSDYFGITPSNDNERAVLDGQKCIDVDGNDMHTTESYYDIIYGRNDDLEASGLTTLDQFVNETNDSLDISPYHTKQLMGWSSARERYNKFVDWENLADLVVTDGGRRNEDRIKHFFEHHDGKKIFSIMKYNNTEAELKKK